MSPATTDTRPTATTDPAPVMTPAGLRAAAEAGPHEVPEHLRADYDAAPHATADAYLREMGTVREESRPSFELWAHRRRMWWARSQAETRALGARLEARKRACDSCGGRFESYELRCVARSVSSAFHLPGATPGRRVAAPTLWACSACLPAVERAMRESDVLPDGRTRAEAAAEAADRLRAELRDYAATEDTPAGTGAA